MHTKGRKDDCRHSTVKDHGHISIYSDIFKIQRASLVAQLVKNLPAMQETWIQSLGQEDPLEKEMATHSSTLAWKMSWMEEPDGRSPWGRKELDTTEQLHFKFV